MISLFAFVVVAACLGMTHADVCSFHEENILSQLAKSCPVPLVNGNDESYCCINTDGTFRCCNFYEFAALYLIIGAVFLIVLSILVSIICCCCCPCCFIYKRRHPV